MLNTNTPPPGPTLQKLSATHKQALSLVAQGVDRATVGEACGFVPEYISWLVRQPVCQEYLAGMRAIVDYQLEAMTSESVSVIRDVMQTGANDDRLKAAKLQLEAVGRVGGGNKVMVHTTPNTGEDHLERLANRLVSLLSGTKVVYDRQEGMVYEDAIYARSGQE